MESKVECVKVFDEKFHRLAQLEPQILGCVDPATLGVLSIDEDGNDDSMEEAVGRSTLSCSYCKVEFQTVFQQREHYKLDWHRYNLKRHMNGQRAVSEHEFETKTDDDVSSISGSDSESEESSSSSSAALLAQNQGRIYIKMSTGQVCLLYRCLLAEKKREIVDVGACLAQLQNHKWAILMLGGGHFAGAIFEESQAKLHKTFHCYTVRAGQGGAQSARDNKNASSAPRSAGASLRRYNEQAFTQHVGNILESWKDELEQCSVIAYRAAGPYNRSVLFGTKSLVVVRSDPRVRAIPFATRRPTFKEVQRVHDMLSDVILYDSIASIPREMKECGAHSEGQRKRSKSRNPSINRAKSRETPERPLPWSNEDFSRDDGDCLSLGDDDEDNATIDVTYKMNDLEVSFEDVLEPFGDSLTPAQRKAGRKKRPKSGGSDRQEMKQRNKSEARFKYNLHQSILTSNMTRFRHLLKQNPELVSVPLDPDNNTALHICAELKKADYIMVLFEVDADLCVRNLKQQTPYTMTLDKSIRDMFKLYAQENPDKFNYNKAQIPVSERLSPEQIEEKKLKQQQQRKAKREKEKEKRRQKLAEKLESEERERFAALSDREKRALAAERRILGANGSVISRCYLCGLDMTGKVPFEYSTYRFCSMDCLKAHRIKHPVVLS